MLHLVATRHSNTLNAFIACSLPEDYILPILFTSVLISSSFVSFNNQTSSLLFRKFRNNKKNMCSLVPVLSACYNTKFYKSALCDVTGQWHALSLWSSCGASRPADHRIPKKDHVKNIEISSSNINQFSAGLCDRAKSRQPALASVRGVSRTARPPGSANEREGAFGRFWPARSLAAQTKTEVIYQPNTCGWLVRAFPAHAGGEVGVFSSSGMQLTGLVNVRWQTSEDVTARDRCLPKSLLDSCQAVKNINSPVRLTGCCFFFPPPTCCPSLPVD